LSSVVAVLAFLSLSLAGAAQARPLAAPAAVPSELFQQLWQWMGSGLSCLLNKDGVGMDPNGAKRQETRPPSDVRLLHERAVGEPN
jgi:hypothetical protein